MHQKKYNYYMEKLNEIAKKYGLKGFSLKICNEMTGWTINNDSRGALEGTWIMDSKKANNSDFVLGINENKVFAVYRMVKGSAKKVSDISKMEWDSFEKLQKSRGIVEQRRDYEKSQKRVIFELVPIAAPKENKVKNEKPTDVEKKFIKEVLGREVYIKKGTQNPIRYFNF